MCYGSAEVDGSIEEAWHRHALRVARVVAVLIDVEPIEHIVDGREVDEDGLPRAPHDARQREIDALHRREPLAVWRAVLGPPHVALVVERCAGDRGEWLAGRIAKRAAHTPAAGKLLVADQRHRMRDVERGAGAETGVRVG